MHCHATATGLLLLSEHSKDGRTVQIFGCSFLFDSEGEPSSTSHMPTGCRTMLGKTLHVMEPVINLPMDHRCQASFRNQTQRTQAHGDCREKSGFSSTERVQCRPKPRFCDLSLRRLLALQLSRDATISYSDRKVECVCCRSSTQAGRREIVLARNRGD